MDQCVTKKYRSHPADKALNVRKAVTKIPATEVRTTYASPRKWMPAQGVEGKIFRRLAESYTLLTDPVADAIYSPSKRRRVKREKNKDGEEVLHIIPDCPITIPTCCSFHRRQVRDVVNEHRKFLYNSPEPLVPQRRAPNRLEQLVHKGHIGLSTIDRQLPRQLPLSTVAVRWHDMPGDPGYDVTSLHEIMKNFGPITDLCLITPCSAYVTYEELVDSCEAVRTHRLGRPDNKLFCDWWHRSMTNKKFYRAGKRLKVSYNEFILPSK